VFFLNIYNSNYNYNVLQLDFTVHTAHILQYLPIAIFHERRQPLSVAALTDLSAQHRD